MSRATETLRGLIVDEIVAADGAIPFCRFMALALYASDLGYYTGPRIKIGKEGDFFTSLDVHPIFGRLVASQVIEMSRSLPDGPYTVVEMGAGKGLLAYDVLRTIEAAAPALFARLRYVIVDVSADLIARQKQLLSAYAERITWADGLEQLSDINGVFLSNELVDSFAHHRVAMTDDGLREVYVGEKNGRFREALGPLSNPALGDYFDALNITLPVGYRTEINLNALAWIRQVGRALSCGHVLTIDYGYPADIYYRSDRKTGTFLCFHEHKVSEDPYARVGEQDMTAHVDFSSLAQAGQEVGLEPRALTDQAHFLVGLGITHAMEKVLERDGGDPTKSDEFCAIRKLMDPHGMGKAFKVLVQTKAVGEESLSGTAFPAFSVSDLVPGMDEG
jgi:SAM-dependent MidA family methyltransferase